MSDSVPPQTVKPAGTSAAEAQAVQGVAGGVPVAISGSFSATTAAHATAAAPTYVEGTDNPLSVDLSGGLRTAGGGGGGLTDTQLRASPVPVSGPLTDTQLRASAVPVSAAALPLPAGAAADATLTGGTQKAIVRGGAKGTTTAADVTSTASGANHNGADVVLYDAAGNLIDPRSIRALTASDVVTAAQGAPMRNKGHITPPLYMLELVSFGAAQNVSTLTTLLPFTDLGSENQALMVVLDNQSLTDPVTLIVDVSHGGVHPNSARQQTAVAQPEDEASIEIGAPEPYTFIRVAAQTASPFPVAAIKWAIVVQQR